MKTLDPACAKIVIIGSRGRMGKMLLSRARQAAWQAEGIDLPYEKEELERACAGASLVIFCVPAGKLRESLEHVLPFLPQDAIVSDITSVKEWPMRQMEECWTGEVVGTHPLFGPGASPEDDQPVAIVPGKTASSRAVRLLDDFFSSLGCRVFECDAKKHDEAMARIQNMNFITNLAYFAVLAGQTDLLPFLTPSFVRRKNAAAKMLTEDADMFAGLFEANQHSQEAVRQFRKMLNIAASGDIDLLLRKADWWWQDKGEKVDSRADASPGRG